ncbi:MAG: hypothetical protein ACREP9_22230, partial [Candidatus Dormibacteraceae bacterium]
MRVSLENGGPGSCHFSALAPQIARGCDLIKTSMRGRKGRKTGKRSLTGGGPRSIDIHNHPMLA